MLPGPHKSRWEISMSMRGLFLLVIALLLMVFVAANWIAFTTPTTLSLLLATVQAPLGIVMLMILGLTAMIFLAYGFYLQSRNARESRRMLRALEHERELASNAEQSRLAELRSFIEARFDKLVELHRGRGESVASGQDLERLIEQGFNGVAAQIAELDDRLTRREPGPPL